MTPASDASFDAFLKGQIDPDTFDHTAHIEYAERLLAGHDFLEAVYLYDRSLQKITASLGIPEKRSVTKTLAFMSLIAETGGRPSPSILHTWYSEDRLSDPAGRDQFLMPDRVKHTLD